MCLRCLNKISPKTFGPHCVFAATLHIEGRYSRNMNNSPSQLKQNFWAKKIIKHIFQKLTAVSNSCSTTWRQKSLLNYRFVGSWLQQFCCKVGWTSWHYITETKHTRSYFRACLQLMTIIIKMPTPVNVFFSSSDAEHTMQLPHRSAQCCPGRHYKLIKLWSCLLGRHIGDLRSKIVLRKQCLLYTLYHISVHLSTSLSRAQTHPLFLVEQCINLMQRGIFDS